MRELGFSIEPVQTNMVYVQVGERARALGDFLAGRGIRVTPAPRMRLVTHLDVQAADVSRVIEAFAAFR
ncbi:Low specificity L-threonine aldolase [compost metagenome]